MSNARMNGLQYFVIIADQKKKDKLLSLLSDHGARGIETVYAHGSMSPSALAAAFGLDEAPPKVMISCLVKDESARELIAVLHEDYKFDKPNTGIAFGISVEGLVF